ncbi:spore coat protein YlbD [Fervidibacillus albus]|uniref:YlbD family protein n=1 Tax=Fervidibacillus albus TaxID=2980026 RepID=A0A9E8RWF0_9BACI|nr:spore coat protein YlbD [Fervidibacillus albus]WAA10606.1 YlbD family protein [Fervidibacillus albus]
MMANKKLHPSVQKFKRFIQTHPLIVKEVRKGNYSWQELFEEWYLLGENDPKWKAYTTEREMEEHRQTKEDDTFAFFQQLAKTLKNVDLEKIQTYMKNLNEAIGTIQGILSEWQRNQKDGEGNGTTGSNGQRENPFSFRRD